MIGAAVLSNGNPFMQAQEGDTVSVYYVVTLDDDRVVGSNVWFNDWRFFFKEYNPENGSVFYSRSNIIGDPLVFVLGEGRVISGYRNYVSVHDYASGGDRVFAELENAVYGMSVNQTKIIHLSPDEGFGQYNPDRVITYNREDAMSVWGKRVILGETVYVENLGEGVVKELNDEIIVVDYNPAYAGQYLNIEIKLLKIK